MHFVIFLSQNFELLGGVIFLSQNFEIRGGLNANWVSQSYV